MDISSTGELIIQSLVPFLIILLGIVLVGTAIWGISIYVRGGFISPESGRWKQNQK
jgi:hypothetical protein